MDKLAVTTEDHLLGGRVRLLQPRHGLRAGMDAVLLAAAIPAKSGDHVIEGGCGTGAGFLCLLARQPDLTITAVERDPALAELARENAALNGVADRVTILIGDIASDEIRRCLPQSRHAFANPPYWPAGSLSPDPLKAGATHTAGGPGLGDWARALCEPLAHRGSLTFILPASRHTDAGAALRQGARSRGVSLLPLWPRQGLPAKRVLLQVLRGDRSADRLLPGLALHQDSGWTVEAGDILQHGTSLPWQ